MADKTIGLDDMVVHVLNVGFGDAIVVELPKNSQGKRWVGIVDCYKGPKTLRYLRKIRQIRPFEGIAFVCATHPHQDHIAGINAVLTDAMAQGCEFWDSGFRHQSATYKKVLETVRKKHIPMRRVSSGMEWYYGKVRITVLAPSVALRNRYATYGVDMNNASVVLRLEHCADDAVTVQSLRYTGSADPDAVRSAGKSVVILAGDAEFDSWAQVTEEYPFIESGSKNKPLVKKRVNLLNCSVIKVAHHGSMHSAPLDVYERMTPTLAVVSNKQSVSPKTIRGRKIRRGLFPHQTTSLSLQEVGSHVLTTDGSHETSTNAARYRHAGTVVAVVPAGKKPWYTKLKDKTAQTPEPPHKVKAKDLCS